MRNQNMKNLFTADAMQSNLGFVTSQTSHIEAGVYRIKYPDIQYQSLIPVDTSANPWSKSVTYFSMDGRGQAGWISGKANDIPLVGTSMEKFETSVYMAGIGYDYGLEEVGQAQMMGVNLGNEKAMVARRAYEEMVDAVALTGDAEKGFEGLFSYTGVTADTAPNGAGGNPEWSTKTPDEIIADVNAMLIAINSATNTVAMADTVLLPVANLQLIASTRLTDTAMTILDFIKKANVYTATTGQELTIRGARGLATAGAAGVARAVAYRRSPEVLKLHIPMAHRFLPVQVIGLQYVIPGIFRLGGLDIRLPKEVRYMDGV